MKKVLLIIPLILSVFMLSGCDSMMDTPTEAVKEYLGRYQNMDNSVSKELEDLMAKEENLTEEQQKTYTELMEKQYQNLSYKIKDEKVDGDSATVDVEIEVLDYQSSVNKSKEYYKAHQSEFSEEADSDDETDGLIEDAQEALEKAMNKSASFINYKLSQLKNVTDKTKYEITFDLKREDKEWVIEDLSEDDISKIHGLY